MKAGIIAAGDGLRLRSVHPGPKPLIPIAGKPLCHWVVSSLAAAGAESVTLLLNTKGRAVRESLERAFPAIAWRFLEKDTATSWESFRLVARTLAEDADSFVMSTVDALIPASEVARFASEAAASGAAAALALTSFIDDEKPLWAELSGSRVRALGEEAHVRTFATSGLYFLKAPTARRMPEASAFPSLRGYLSSLVSEGEVAGVVLSKTLDVDRAEDIAQAESFLLSRSL